MNLFKNCYRVHFLIFNRIMIFPHFKFVILNNLLLPTKSAVLQYAAIYIVSSSMNTVFSPVRKKFVNKKKKTFTNAFVRRRANLHFKMA